MRKILGENIKRCRLANKYTIETLSNEAGIAFSTLSLIERGKCNTSIGILEKISSSLGVSVPELVGPQSIVVQETQDRIVQPFKYERQINQLPLPERKIVNSAVGEMLSLIETVAKRGEKA